jgi:hypothetical protein
MILKIFSPKNWHFLLKTKLNYAKTLVFEKKSIFSPEIGKIRRNF